MCFSATASFAASTILIATGVVAVMKLAQNKSYLFFAMIPILFGLQQAAEGMVWLTNADYFALIFMFFAYFLWPVYFPFSLYQIEKIPERKQALFLITLSGLLLGIILYLPILLNWVEHSIQIEHHSICYTLSLSYAQKYACSLIYVTILLLSMLTSSIKDLKLFALLTLVSFLVAAYWFEYAFASVWCFFAACLSVYIVFIIMRRT